MESGRLKETKISVCPYEMFEMELLDRALVSLQKTEDAYVDINNRIIENVNQRKSRLNDINRRIQLLSQKVLGLYEVNETMKIQTSGVYPKLSNGGKTRQH